jgi:hypothetical protein
MDFKAAYDNVQRNKFYKAMEELGIPLALGNLTKTTMRNVKCREDIE